MFTEQEQWWAGDFGTAYTQRNGITKWRARVPFWADIIARTGARSILEVGCNAGMNLRAIREVNPMLDVWGIEPNQTAVQAAADAGHAVVEASVFDLEGIWWEKFDLVFTSGVLIHIGPAHIERAMRAIIGASKRYVLAVEYADEWEVEVQYRGHDERLWRRPFGKMYQELGLNLVAEGEAPADAFDRCHYWLLQKA